MSDNPQVDTTETQVSRRKYLKASGLGLSLAGFSGFAASQFDRTEVVTARAGGTPIETKKVPTEWHDHEQQAEKIQERIISNRAASKGVFRIALVNSDEQVGGYAKSKIEVSVRPQAKAPAIPAHVEGVPVDMVQEENTMSPDSCSEDICNDGDYDPVPGGVAISNPDGGSGTSTGKAWGPAGNPGLVTCAHLFSQGRTCGRDITGETLNQSSSQMGEVPGAPWFDHEEDWVFIDKTGNETSGYQNWIEGVGLVVGHYTKLGLQDLKSNNETVHKMGLRTCETSEQITGVNVWASGGADDCFTTSYGVELEGCAMSGDSGCPHYHRYHNKPKDRTEAKIICPHWGGSDTYNYGTGVYHMWSQHGIRWTPP